MIPLFLVYYTPASQVGCIMFVMSVGTSIRHTWGVHISNSLLLLHQLMDFNETFMDIFLTQ